MITKSYKLIFNMRRIYMKAGRYNRGLSFYSSGDGTGALRMYKITYRKNFVGWLNPKLHKSQRIINNSNKEDE